MFKSYEFTFDGVSSEMYGLHMFDIGDKKQKPVSFGNRASISETRSASRVRPMHYGVNYNASPLEFTLVFGAEGEKYLDRYEMEEVALWLTGHQDYKWLTICQSDLEHCMFRCIITQLTPIHVAWSPVAFEATVRCDCPYAYGYPFEETYRLSGTQTVIFRNNGSCREPIKPDISFVPSSGGGSLSIVNESDGGRELRLDSLPNSASAVTIDNEHGIIRGASGHNYYAGFNMNFFRAVQGDNRLTITGRGTLKISGRFLYNVAG
jgi:phage-related protein